MKKHISVRDDTRNCLKVDAYYKVKGFIPDSVLRPFSVDLWNSVSDEVGWKIREQIIHLELFVPAEGSYFEVR